MDKKDLNREIQKAYSNGFREGFNKYEERYIKQMSKIEQIGISTAVYKKLKDRVDELLLRLKSIDRLYSPDLSIQEKVLNKVQREYTLTEIKFNLDLLGENTDV